MPLAPTAVPKRPSNVFPSIFILWKSLRIAQDLARDLSTQLSQQDLHL